MSVKRERLLYPTSQLRFLVFYKQNIRELQTLKYQYFNLILSLVSEQINYQMRSQYNAVQSSYGK